MKICDLHDYDETKGDYLILIDNGSYEGICLEDQTKCLHSALNRLQCAARFGSPVAIVKVVHFESLEVEDGA